MTTAQLSTPQEATALIAKLFASLPADEPAVLSLREDICFAGAAPLKVAEITLHPLRENVSGFTMEAALRAIDYGFFECSFFPSDAVVDGLRSCLGLNNEAANSNQVAKAREALRSLASLCTRIGLCHPKFDADAVARMPLRRSTTVIADTCSVIQGGLDFVVRFLCPIARIKVPAIVHMELLNASDAYFTLRRNAPGKLKKGEAILHHAISQGGQRVLLRLELHTDTEVERTSIFADPLRNAFTSEKSTDAKDLTISAPIRGYCDRLILETARQHQAQTSPGHPVWIMTSDQGMARMALAEGIEALFFKTPSLSDVCGRIIAGTCFHPFAGTLYSVPLVQLIWEIAVTFGSAQLASADGSCLVQVSAIGEQFSWQPFHSKEDLLWVESSGISLGSSPRAPVSLLPVASDSGKEIRSRLGEEKRESATSASLSGAYKFSIDGMLRLIQSLYQAVEIPEKQAARIVGVNATQLGDYRNFLVAGEFITLRDSMLVKANRLDELAAALQIGDWQTIARNVLYVQSFKLFIEYINKNRPSKSDDAFPIASRAISTYVGIAEISALAVNIPEEGVYSTPARPSAEEFIDLAVSAYESLKRDDVYVSTGTWLETLVRTNAVHPIIARERLEEGRRTGLIERFTEGATPDTRYERHTLRAVERSGASIVVRQYHLYHGDFLIPGKASVSLRLERVHK
jgi:hypothetical protein